MTRTRPPALLRAVEAVVEAVTSPRIDVDRQDARVIEVVADGALPRAIGHWLERIRRDWLRSYVRAVVALTRRDDVDGTAGRGRAVGAGLVVAGTVAVLGEFAASRPEPLVWMLPAAAAAAGATFAATRGAVSERRRRGRG